MEEVEFDLGFVELGLSGYVEIMGEVGLEVEYFK